MEFTKEMTKRLYDLIRRNNQKFMEIIYPATTGWDSEEDWLKKLGIERISRESVIGDADRFKGMLIIDNPCSWTRRPGYLLVPKEVAEKILVLLG